jgi:dimethylaniline monooxygenase (N-oxide forming)
MAFGYLVSGEPAPPRAEGAIAPDQSLPRACVIGAGSTGIAAAKALYEARVPFDCFELGPEVGGLWVFENPNGLSGAYATLEMNTSGPRMSYSDFPAPSTFADYPMHWEVREYFDRYVDHFGFRETITFNTKVEHVERRDDGTFEVTISRTDGHPGTPGSEAEEVPGIGVYDAIFVCNGHHWDPRWPEPPFPGEFDGIEMHSHDYRDAEPFAGKRAVVVGGGNSGVDIAVATSRVSERTFVSLRRGVHVIRKRLGGKPVDQKLPPTWLPWPLKQKGFELLRWRSGSISDHGFPEPDHKVGHAHPTVSDDFLDRLAEGGIVPKPDIRELRGGRVEFDDGSLEEVDAIVYCTGYRISFPFFDPEFISAPDNDLPLFRRVFHPDVPGVYFVGLAQPLGAIMPMAEETGKWVAQLLTGRYRLPAADEVRADMAAERKAHAKRFYRSARHTMEVDFDEWLAGARKERARGARRAEAAGYAPEVPARARAPEVSSSSDGQPAGSPAGRSTFSGRP